jgi:transaldolase/glucose-6-phosphate isomerase
MSKLSDLSAQGTAVWLDFVARRFLNEGGLQKLVEQDGLTGVTSNPSIFEKAMGHGDAYDDSLANYDREHPGAATIDRYEAQAIEDIRMAADILRPVYDRLDAKDGYVSLEVSPYIADDTDSTITEAQKLWHAVDKPNLMIKIPGSLAGGPAISATIAQGINVNVTLLFALDAYIRVAEAYAAGLEERVRQGQPIDRIASVASFFVSRIDATIDKEIDRRVTDNDPESDALKALRGKVAIANAKMAYQWFLDFEKSDRWQALAAKGAQPQRLLWASTGVKDKAYPDTLYVDTLIGRDTVNTMPPATMDAFRERGTATATLTDGVDEAKQVMAEADRLGLNLTGVTDMLVSEGVASFAKAFDDLLGALAKKQPATA